MCLSVVFCVHAIALVLVLVLVHALAIVLDIVIGPVCIRAVVFLLCLPSRVLVCVLVIVVPADVLLLIILFLLLRRIVIVRVLALAIHVCGVVIDLGLVRALARGWSCCS